ncbi:MULTISPECIES: hypothetical protein [unclassified Streptomyces]|uniref:hypothetical protein n=1 Tax=unclassified Streptomyces TaxID=2593676 RepID=UPI00093F349B|nr:hypothetical protein [Streptomyces sp. TSRI0281]OKI34987.1 hypothetical protein A6A29_16310 [Streptomyces sp. TSRI0281]
MTEQLPEEVRRLVDAVEALIAIEDDAECAEAISAALKYWGDSSPKLREARQERVKKLKGKGRTWQELGDLMGVHFTRAQQIGSGISGAARQRKKAQQDAAAKAAIEESTEGQPGK